MATASNTKTVHQGTAVMVQWDCNKNKWWQQENILKNDNTPVSEVVAALLLWHNGCRNQTGKQQFSSQISDGFSSGNTMFSAGCCCGFIKKNVMAMATANQEKWKIISQSTDGNSNSMQHMNCSISDSPHCSMRWQQHKLVTAGKTFWKMTICHHAEVVVALFLLHNGVQQWKREAAVSSQSLNIDIVLVTQSHLLERQ